MSEPTVELLSNVVFFSDCSRRELQKVAKGATEVRVPSGEVIVREGEEADAFYVLAEGLAHASVGGERVGTVKPGTAFGEVALLDDGPRSATVTTALPSRLLRWDERHFEKLLAGTSVATRLAKLSATRLRATDEALSHGERS